jgi:hypothetical protein
MKISIKDSFDKSHSKRFWIPVVGMEEAKKYNPSFGKTLSELRKK